MLLGDPSLKKDKREGEQDGNITIMHLLNNGEHG
jgi:hypothetical protein